MKGKGRGEGEGQGQRQGGREEGGGRIGKEQERAEETAMRRRREYFN